MDDQKLDITQGSGNVFADLDLSEPADLGLKSAVAMEVNAIIDHRHLKQEQAAKLLGVAQSKVSALRNGRLHGFSLETLILFMVKLDRNVHIRFTIKDAASASAKITVAARKQRVAVAA